MKSAAIIFTCRWAWLFFVLQSATVSSMAQRDTIELNQNWQFKTDRTNAGFAAKWYETVWKDAETVQVPHTWNVTASTQNYYGWSWYQKKIDAPAAWKNKQIRLRLGAVNHSSVIYLNGKKIEENTGDGYSSFVIDLSGKLRFGKENNITIAVTNEYGKNKLPFGSSFDWPNDGGLIRKTSLIISGRPSANTLQVTPVLKLPQKEGAMHIQLGFEKPDSKLRLHIRVSEENQLSDNIVYNDTLQPEWQDNKAAVQLKLPNINPWHFDFPNLYRVDVRVLSSGRSVDLISTVIGFREIKFVNGQTFLNGERVKMMGTEWTAGSNPDLGLAEPDTAIIRYCKLLKEVNTIFTRQHFQQDELFYDFCDRKGILVQQELPLWGPETPVNDTTYAIAMKQLQRMITGYYNHPSIFSWGVGNELRGRDPEMKQFIAALMKRSRELDPSRFTAYVSNTLTWGFINNPAFTPDAAAAGDYLAMNEYGGSWWDLPTGKIHSYLDSVHMSYPDKPFFISEFGLCEPNFKGGDERRVEDLIYHMGIYETKPYVEGAIYFDLTDYRTHYPGTADTTRYRRRIHGVYDMYGNPKPSMKVLRELSSPVEIQGLRQWKKGKLTILLFGSVGLPQHTATGYKLYVSDKTENYINGQMYELPVISPGERANIEVNDVYHGKAVITIVRPTGYVVSQKQFD